MSPRPHITTGRTALFRLRLKSVCGYRILFRRTALVIVDICSVTTLCAAQPQQQNVRSPAV